MRNWKALLEKDQLRIEQRGGRVFAGWNEGRIYFPPTYKYSTNSDKYAGEDMNQKEKRRTPAWYDYYTNVPDICQILYSLSKLGDPVVQVRSHFVVWKGPRSTIIRSRRVSVLRS
uniref:Inositol polyphosphate-related phosphatase domain-containing protein n=1 Tax=Aegilops tauschii subsp. strangulata TaxID=200361 RepID=A0A453ITE9_AEGTS